MDHRPAEPAEDAPAQDTGRPGTNIYKQLKRSTSQLLRTALRRTARLRKHAAPAAPTSGYGSTLSLPTPASPSPVRASAGPSQLYGHRRSSRQSIFLPALSASPPPPRPHSPTDLALSHLDRILQGAPTPPPELPPPAPAPLTHALYALSPPHRPARKTSLSRPLPELGLRRHPSNPDRPPHKVVIHPEAWQAISISASRYHHQAARCLQDPADPPPPPDTPRVPSLAPDLPVASPPPP
ncbi:hypothetical protein PtB15_5B775 [Puccinia triticina]|nr:hypothetical protein PtB15_5B775 [Puccinia triticina]